MSVPAKKQPSSKTRRRRSHHNMSPAHLADCPTCKEKTIPHQVCANCGHYKGEKIKEVK